MVDIMIDGPDRPTKICKLCKKEKPLDKFIWPKHDMPCRQCNNDAKHKEGMRRARK